MFQIKLNISLTLLFPSAQTSSPPLIMSPELVNDTTIYQVAWARTMPGGFLWPSLSLSALTPTLNAEDFTPMMTCLILTLFPHPHCQNCNAKLHYFLRLLLQKPPLTSSFKSLVLVLPRQSNCLTLEQFRVQSIDHVSINISSLVISASHMVFSITYVPTPQFLASKGHLPKSTD